MLGSYHKVPTKSELKNIKTVRKSLVLSKPLEKGDKILEDTLTVKRPGKGIPSINYTEYLGKTLNKNTKKNHMLNKNDIKN
jgi:sialic acid synthase SpsE